MPLPKGIDILQGFEIVKTSKKQLEQELKNGRSKWTVRELSTLTELSDSTIRSKFNRKKCNDQIEFIRNYDGKISLIADESKVRELSGLPPISPEGFDGKYILSSDFQKKYNVNRDWVKNQIQKPNLFSPMNYNGKLWIQDTESPLTRTYVKHKRNPKKIIQECTKIVRFDQDICLSNLDDKSEHSALDMEIVIRYWVSNSLNLNLPFSWQEWYDNRNVWSREESVEHLDMLYSGLWKGYEIVHEKNVPTRKRNRKKDANLDWIDDAEAKTASLNRKKDKEGYVKSAFTFSGCKPKAELHLALAINRYDFSVCQYGLPKDEVKKRYEDKVERNEQKEKISENGTDQKKVSFSIAKNDHDFYALSLEESLLPTEKIVKLQSERKKKLQEEITMLQEMGVEI